MHLIFEISSWVIAQHAGPFFSALVFPQHFADVQMSSESKSESKIWGDFALVKNKEDSVFIELVLSKSLSLISPRKTWQGAEKFSKWLECSSGWETDERRKGDRFPRMWSSWMEDETSCSREGFPCTAYNLDNRNRWYSPFSLIFSSIRFELEALPEPV